MATNECKNAGAVRELLNNAEPEHFIEVITDMWEAWIASDMTDSANSAERMDKLLGWKHLCKFLKSVER